MKAFFALLAAILLSGCLWVGGSSQTLSLGQRLPTPNEGFYGLDGQAVSSEEQKFYTFNLPKNASYMFVGALAREGTVYLEVKNSSNYVYPAYGGSAVIENVQEGIYTVTVTGTGKYVVFWDYMYVPFQPCIPNCADKCGGVSDGCGGTCNADCGPLGSRNNPVKLNQAMPKNALWYGYNLNYSPEYTIPKGATRYFEVDPVGYGFGTGTGIIMISIFDYDQSPNVRSTLIAINKNTGAQKGTQTFSGAQAHQRVRYTPPNPPDEKYIIECTETGVKNQPISVWWEFSTGTKAVDF
jgi:hypothetical protein